MKYFIYYSLLFVVILLVLHYGHTDGEIVEHLKNLTKRDKTMEIENVTIYSRSIYRMVLPAKSKITINNCKFYIYQNGKMEEVSVDEFLEYLDNLNKQLQEHEKLIKSIQDKGEGGTK